MKITLITQYFFPEQFSNNEIVRHLSEDLHHDVHVVTCVPNYPAGEFFPGYSNTERRNDTFHGARVSRCWTVARGQHTISMFLNYVTFPVSASWTLWRKGQETPDVSLVSMPSPLLQALAGIFLKWRKKTPLVYWVQDIWPESAIYTLKITNPLIVKPLMKLCGWIYRRADLILVQSAAFPAMIERFGVEPEKIRVFPNTAPKNYQPLVPNCDSRIGKMMPKSGFNLMFAGNIGESQDFDTYLEAASLLRDRSDLNWVIVGSGRDMERVQLEVSRLNLNDRFHFLGRHPEEDMPEFFSHADAMLVGLKDNDIFRLTVPYKVQCYMACGKPIIASLNGEGARIIEQAKVGYTSPAETPKALAANITKLIDAPESDLNEMKEAGRAYFVEYYHSDIVYRNLNVWLQQVAEGSAVS